MMRGLTPIFRLIALTWYRWALRELSHKNPLHPDVPVIVMRINELERA